MIYKLQRWLWNKCFSLDKLLSGMQRLMARLEKLRAYRESEVEQIEERTKRLFELAAAKASEANRAKRIRDRFADLLS